MDGSLLLVASLLPLVLGPGIAYWADRRPGVRVVMDGFVGAGLGGIVLLHVWPHAWMVGGLWALAAGVVGLVLPNIFHLAHHRTLLGERTALPGLVILGVVALAVHAAVDGMALFGGAPTPGEAHDEAGTPALVFAVLLHRLPMALAIWWLARPSLGRRSAIALLGGIGAATLVGYAAAGRVLVGLGGVGMAAFEAGVAGLLLHVVTGGHHHGPRPVDRSPGSHRRLWLIGVVGGLSVVIVLSRLHPLHLFE